MSVKKTVESTRSFAPVMCSPADLAYHSGIPADLAWLWPVDVDGTILQATMAVVVLAAHAGRRADRVFFWCVLIPAAAVSVGGNVLHAVLSRVVAAAVACVAPCSLLATAHGLAVLCRFKVMP
jgi:hypothetical protein